MPQRWSIHQTMAGLAIATALSLADRFGFAPGSKGRTGVVLAAAFGCPAAAARFSVVAVAGVDLARLRRFTCG